MAQSLKRAIARSHQSAPTVAMLRSAATGQQWLRLLAALRFHNAATACLTRPPRQQRGTVLWACLGLAETARYALHPGGLWLYIRLRGAADGVQQRDSYLPASCHRRRITGNTEGAAAAPWIGLARDSSGQPVTSAEPHVDRRARTPGPAGSKWPGRYRVEMVDHLDAVPRTGG